jgi:hypothetical protein
MLYFVALRVINFVLYLVFLSFLFEWVIITLHNKIALKPSYLLSKQGFSIPEKWTLANHFALSF